MVNVLLFAGSFFHYIFFVTCWSTGNISPVVENDLCVFLGNGISTDFSFCVKPARYFTFLNLFPSFDGFADTFII